MKLFATAFVVLIAIAQTATAATPEKRMTIAPKVLVVTMFDGEAQHWIKGENLTTKIRIPGLSEAYPDVLCNTGSLCLVTTSPGYANAASSISALVYSGQLDLSKTYILIAGIAGVDPADGTLGSAHWARYAIDGGLQWAIDARQIPDDWPTGRLGIKTDRPGEKPPLNYGTQIYHLNDALVEKAYRLSKDAELADSDKARAYRARYHEAPANAPPTVNICATISMDTWWHGSLFSKAMNQWARVMTDGAANYCTTQQEDNATLTALQRGANIGRIDMARVAILRVASNFDQEAPGQSVAQSLHADSGGYLLAYKNAYRVGSRLTDAIIEDWHAWKNGVPAQ